MYKRGGGGVDFFYSSEPTFSFSNELEKKINMLIPKNILIGLYASINSSKLNRIFMMKFNTRKHFQFFTVQLTLDDILFP
jgi:hypothetical protein